jgi:hypothetical protein
MCYHLLHWFCSNKKGNDSKLLLPSSLCLRKKIRW